MLIFSLLTSRHGVCINILLRLYCTQIYFCISRAIQRFRFVALNSYLRFVDLVLLIHPFLFLKLARIKILFTGSNEVYKFAILRTVKSV